MSLGGFNQDGAILVHRTRPAGPAPCLNALAPSRQALVVWVACRFPWDWLADLCARAGRPVVLGHARSMHALQGGKAKNATSDAQHIAGL